MKLGKITASLDAYNLVLHKAFPIVYVVFVVVVKQTLNPN